MANEIIIPLKVENPNSIRDLRTNVNQLRDSLVGLDNTSDKYRATLARIGEQQQKLNDINQASRNSALNLEQQLNNVVRISGSVASGFSALTSITALFGSENELLAETFVRVQSAMALAQGVKGLAGLQNTIPAVLTGIRNLTFGLSGLQKALIATGIGAFAVALGVLIANFDKVTNAVNRLIPSLNELKRSNDGYLTSISAINTVLERNISLLRASGATENEILTVRSNATRQIIIQSEERLKALEVEISENSNALYRLSSIYRIYYASRQTQLRNQIQDVKTIIANANDDLSKIQDEYARAAIVRGRMLREQAIKDEEARIDEEKRLQSERLKIRMHELEQIGEINQRILNEDLTAYEIRVNELQDNFIRERTLYVKNGQDITALEKSYYDNLNRIIQDEENRLNNERLKADFDRLNNLDNTNNQALEKQRIYIQELEVLRSESLASGDTGSVEEIENQISNQKALFIQNQVLFLEQYKLGLEELLSSTLLSEEQRIDIENDLQDTLNEIEILGLNERKRIADEEIENQRKNADNEKKILDERVKNRMILLRSFATIANQASSIASQETAAGKVLAVAAATIDTYAAGLSAFRSTPGGPIIKGAALAATIATGLATVKKIVSVNVPGASDSTTVTDIPNVNYEEVTDEPVQRTSNFLTSTEEQELNDLNNRPIWVSVTDIDNAQNNVRVVQSERTF